MGSQFYFSLLLSLNFFLFPFSLTQKIVYVTEDGLQDHNNKMILDIKMKFLLRFQWAKKQKNKNKNRGNN
jgi:hypothetical protein